MKLFFLKIFFFLSLIAFPQTDTIMYEAGFTDIASSGEFAPFWLHHNQYGKIASSPMSGTIWGAIAKEFDKPHRLFDYGFKAHALVRYDSNKNSAVFFHQLYAKARFSVFNLMVGSGEQHFGNQDSTLSSGGLLFSKNTRPMPEISAGIERFTPLPFTGGFLEIKGSIRHGWNTDNIYTQGMLLHHKFGYARIGGRLPVHFEYGLQHAAQWGGTDPLNGPLPDGLKNFTRVFRAQSGDENASRSDQINVLGNHIISQSLKVELEAAGWKLSGYWQNLSEDPPVMFIAANSMNKPDGLWGISLKNRSFPYVKGILYELLNTTDQSGPYHDKDGLIYGGADGYFGGSYPEGWSYYSRIIGTPFITSPLYNTNKVLHTQNNRVRLHHLGMEGNIKGFEYRALASFSRNYGTLGSQVNLPQKSILLEINKHVDWLSGFDLSLSAAGDWGKYYGNSQGVLFSIRKKGILMDY